MYLLLHGGGRAPRAPTEELAAQFRSPRKVKIFSGGGPFLSSLCALRIGSINASE
jgi:hypothetical protein